MQRFYGVRLSDLYAGGLTWRRLGVLIRHLPRESATVRAQFGDEHLWGDQEHLLAVIADALIGANWQRANANNKHPSRPPKPLPRPGMNRATPRGGQRFGSSSMTVEEATAWSAQWNAPAEEVTDGD